VINVHFGCADGIAHAVRLTYGRANRYVRFSIDSAGSDVWVNWIGSGHADPIGTATALLLGPVLASVLRQMGTACLHASVADVGSRAIVFLGEKGAGKSTLAAALASRGHAVMSDDIAAITGSPEAGWVVVPGYPQIRLTADTSTALRTAGATPPPTEWDCDWEHKYYIGLTSAGSSGPWGFQANRRPVGALIEIVPAPAESIPAIAALRAEESLNALIQHIRKALPPLQPTARLSEFTRLKRLSASVPAHRLTIPTDYAALGAVCECVENVAALDRAA
jgi:hypothetical protein